jgi:hypothetical protein
MEEDEMRRGVATTVAVGLVIAIALGGLAIAKGKGAKPVVVRAGNMVMKLQGIVTPKVLPRHELAPIGFRGSVKLSTIDGSHPPAFQEDVFDVDKNVSVSVEGLPVCRVGQLQARGTKEAEAVCGEAILGRGTATVEVAFPEQKPFDSTGPLVFFNGGERNGVLKVFAHAYVNVPAPTAVISTVEATRVHKGAYGLHIETDVPAIAGGAGSAIAAAFTVRRDYTYKGKRRSVISGRCPEGRIMARGTFSFSDSTSLSGALVYPCIARD